jgi:hypothetical protein
LSRHCTCPGTCWSPEICASRSRSPAEATATNEAQSRIYLLPYVAGIVVSGNVHQPSEVATVVALFGQQFLLAVLVVWCVTWLGKP